MFFWRKIDSSLRYAITGFGSAFKFVLTKVISLGRETEKGRERERREGERERKWVNELATVWGS